MALDVFHKSPFDLSPSVSVPMKPPHLHLDLEADYMTLNAQLKMLLKGGLISTEWLYWWLCATCNMTKMNGQRVKHMMQFPPENTKPMSWWG